MICILDDAEATQVDVVASYLTTPWAVALAARHPNRVRSLLLWAGFRARRIGWTTLGPWLAVYQCRPAMRWEAFPRTAQ